VEPANSPTTSRGEKQHRSAAFPAHPTQSDRCRGQVRPALRYALQVLKPVRVAPNGFRMSQDIARVKPKPLRLLVTVHACLIAVMRRRSMLRFAVRKQRPNLLRIRFDHDHEMPPPVIAV